MKIRWCLCLLVLTVAPVILPVQAQEREDRPEVRVAFFSDEPSARDDQFRTLIQEELLELTRNDFDVQFPDAYNMVGDGTAATIAQAVDQLLRDEQVDLVITLSFLGSYLAASGAPWSTPVIATFVIDAELQGLPFDAGTSGTTNLSYLTNPAPFGRDLQTFRQIIPFTTVDLLIIESAVTGFPEFIDRGQQEAAQIGINLRVVPVGTTVAPALEALPEDAEAVYVMPMDHLASGEMDRLVQGLLARRLPSFAFAGEQDVAQGLMASLNVDATPRLARRVALHAQRILLGDDASKLPVYFAPGEKLVMNMRVIRALGFAPPLGLILEAKRLYEEPEGIERQLTLPRAMEEALGGNLSLAVQNQVVAAGEENVRLARSNLLPTLTSLASGVLVEKSVAESSFGSQAQRTLDGTLTLQQILFSENARAGVSIERALQESRLHRRETAELDVALEAAVAYLDVLRAKTLEQVQQNNLELTRTSLRLAEVREQIGAAGPGERLRLQSELALRRADRIEAYSQRRAAEIALNQVLNRPLSEAFLTSEAEEGGISLIEQSFLAGQLQDFGQFVALSDFLVREAFAAAPELRALEAGIEAQERLLVSTRRAFFLPTIALQGEVSTNLFNGGAGTEGLPPELIGEGAASEVTDFPWTIGVSATFPLFEGTARGARREQAAADVAGLQFRRDLAAQRIEQQVRTQLQFAQASFATIAESEAAAEAARRSLELVTDAYGQGVSGVIDLLEAQNRTLVTELGVTNAIYDFLIDLKNVERASGRFEVLARPEEKAAFLDRLNRFYQEAGNTR